MMALSALDSNKAHEMMALSALHSIKAHEMMALSALDSESTSISGWRN